MRTAYFMICFLLFLGPTSSYATTILCLGDSLTEGYGVKREEAWPERIQAAYTTKGKAIKVINAGISGATSASGPSRMRFHLKNITKNPVDLMILALGANDALRGLDIPAARKNLTETITLAQKANIRVVLAGMKAPPNLGKDYTQKFEGMYADLAKEKKLDFIPFLLEGVAGNPKLNIPDGIHPNAAGHAIVANTVMTALGKLKPPL